MNAMKNLDGIKVGGKVLKVFLANYDRNGMIWSSQVPHEEDKDATSKRRANGFREALKDGRSYKDTVGETSYGLFGMP